MARQIISKAVGIDLGTTNSAVAILNPSDTDIVIHKDRATHRTTTPSCVWKDPKSGAIVVGAMAFRRVGTSPAPIRSVKRQMGSLARLRLTDQEVSPEEVSALILREMKRQIEEDTAEFSGPESQWIVDRAIVTVPAYFDQPQVDATRRAAEMAGLEVIELLHEPTAAACHHCWRTGTRNGVFLVYDLGGGTFDVTVLRCTEGVFEVLGISGNPLLGGDDLDLAIAEHLQRQLMREGYALELDARNDPEDALRLTQLCFIAEGVKKALSTSSEFMLRDQSTLRDKLGVPVVIEMVIERAEIEAVIRPLVERTLPYCLLALEAAEKKAGIRLSDVDEVVLAGGSTHIPLVRELVRQAFCRSDATAEPRARSAEPVYQSVDTVVALGAAIRAAAAGGLCFYNPERTVCIALRGTGVTGAGSTHFGGTVRALQPGIVLRGAHIRIALPDLDFEEEAALGDDGSFAFRQVPLQPSADNLVSFEVSDASGQVVATAGRAVVQTRGPVRPTGGNAPMSTQSKAISLEVSRAGLIVMKELLPAQARLPAKAEFKFAHPGGTELLRMPLFQNKRKIQEIKVQVPSSLPKGTEIHFDLEVDLLSFITVRGSVGETRFEAKVEPPPERALPDAKALAQLEERYREGIEYLPAGKKAVQAARWSNARKGFDQASARGDVAQALHDFEEMEEIVAGLARRPGGLEPPKEVFEQAVAECAELNQYVARAAAEAGNPHDNREVAKAIEAQRVQGEKAIAASDQRAYADVLNMLEGIRNHLIGLVRKVVPPPPPLPEGERAAHAVEGGLSDAGKVGHLAAAQQRKDVQTEADEIRQQLQKLADEAQKNPQAVQEKVSALRARLGQLMNMLRGRPAPGGEGAHVEDYSGDAP